MKTLACARIGGSPQGWTGEGAGSGARSTDLPDKLARLRAVLAERGADFLHLSSAEAISWLFDGARVTVPLGGPPVLGAFVGMAEIVVPVFANEIDRMRSEELAHVESYLDLRAVEWFSELRVDALRSAAVLSEAEVSGELRAARAALLPHERARYGRLGREVAEAVSVVLRSAGPAMTERALAADLALAVTGMGADPMVLLVSGASRSLVRHPLPTTAELGSRAMAAVGARRDGMFVSLTRWIEFESDTARDEREMRLREVEADAFEATAPGRSLAEVLADIARSYARHGFGESAWLGHHQGGPTGYAGRDPRATPTAVELVTTPQAFAWNPSVPGAKLEDTIVLDRSGIEIISVDPSWPTVEVRGRARPLALGVG